MPESQKKKTVKELDKVRGMVWRGRLIGKQEIAARVHGILKKYKIGKYYKVDIREDGFNCEINEGELLAGLTTMSNSNQKLLETGRE